MLIEKLLDKGFDGSEIHLFFMKHELGHIFLKAPYMTDEYVKKYYKDERVKTSNAIIEIDFTNFKK